MMRATWRLTTANAAVIRLKATVVARNGIKAGGVEGNQDRGVADGLSQPGGARDRAERRTDARGPGDRERGADDDRAATASTSSPSRPRCRCGTRGAWLRRPCSATAAYSPPLGLLDLLRADREYAGGRARPTPSRRATGAPQPAQTRARECGRRRTRNARRAGQTHKTLHPPQGGASEDRDAGSQADDAAGLAAGEQQGA
jgi:hypothetical protein